MILEVVDHRKCDDFDKFVGKGRNATGLKRLAQRNVLEPRS